jgi:hypothetical protein
VIREDVFMKIKSDLKPLTDELVVLKGSFVDYMYVVDEDYFMDGETIIKQGYYGSWIWVLLDGIVEISYEIDNKEISLFRLSKGSFIGRIASLLVSDAGRHYNAKAIGNVQLGVIDSQQLSRECSCLSKDFKNILLSFDNRMVESIKQAARQVICKKNVDINSSFEEIEIIKDFKDTSNVYIIENGCAYIKTFSKGSSYFLYILGKDDFIGKIPFLEMGYELESVKVYVSKKFSKKPFIIDNIMDEYKKISVTLKNILKNFSDIVKLNTELVIK